MGWGGRGHRLCFLRLRTGKWQVRHWKFSWLNILIWTRRLAQSLMAMPVFTGARTGAPAVGFIVEHSQTLTQEDQATFASGAVA